MTTLRDRFAAQVRGPHRTDLARGALEIARIAHPDLDPAPWLARLDALADAARPHIPADASPDARTIALAAFLFGECGFRGNQESYYDPRNSFLNEVLDRRTGIPITLAVVLIEVARRLDLRLEGVGFPGHFLVRLPMEPAPLVLDPFFGGRPLGPSELLERLRALQPGRPARQPVGHVPPQLLEPTDTPGILARMLRNLLRIYLDQSEWADALNTVDMLLVLMPEGAEEIRIRGQIYERLDCLAAALDDYRRYLALQPDAADAADVRRRLTRLVRTAPTVH